jgi:S1-C subfamily serine protease
VHKFNIKSFLIGIAISVFVVVVFAGGAIADRIFVIKPLDLIAPRGLNHSFGLNQTSEQLVLNEESVVTDVAEEVSPSVVTVSIQEPERRILEFSPFGGFRSRVEGGEPQDIGTGFIVDKDGLIITNKHVVSEKNADYKVITQNGEEYEVLSVSRDPSNDIAVLKIDAKDLKPVVMGSSENLKVGQFVIAIGTALGEFRHTVTTGVVSGLGRGITAGSVFEGYVEKLDDVIQTDAAINPGNSGGPLLNSAGQVVGVNVAVAAGAENVGFAIPVDVVKQALDQFEETGSFVSKPYLGVEYQMISEQAAILNDVPQGAFVVNVVEGSPAESAGIQANDIIVSLDNQKLSELEEGLAEAIESKKAGQDISLEVWRDGETINLKATLSQFNQ